MKRLTMLIVLAASAAHAAEEPAPAPLPAARPVRRALSREQIQTTFSSVHLEIKHCYEVELQTHRELAGRVTIGMVIAGDGTVARVWAQESTFDDRVVEFCMLRVLGRLRFPAPLGGGMVNVTYPFIFTNGIKRSFAVLGPRKPAEVNRTMQLSAPAFEACMVERPSPSSEGTATVLFAIGAAGETRRVFVTNSTLHSVDADACLTEEVKALRFPPVDGDAETRVSYPLRFLPPAQLPPAQTPPEAPKESGNCGWPW